MRRDSVFRVSARSENKTKTVVKARGFSLVVDEPPVLGGKDEGANPVEFVLVALAGCLNVVGHVVAKEMGIQIKSLEFELSGSLNPEKFMGKKTFDRAGYKNIEVKIYIDSDADELTLVKWLEEIEKRCPVSDNLANPTPLEFSLNFKSETVIAG